MERLPNFDPEQMKRLAESDAGKQLFALLQQNQSDQLKEAMDHAAAGDYTKAKKAMSSLMNSPHAMELIRHLRSGQNG